MLNALADELRGQWLPLPAGVEETPVPPPRCYCGTDAPAFQNLRRKLESGWIAELEQRCGVAPEQSPTIWDIAVLLRPTTATGEDSYLLCEVNVTGVSPSQTGPPQSGARQ